MSELSHKYINYNNTESISDNAFKYDFKKEDVSEKHGSIFGYYDTDGNNILNKSELERLKKDIDVANSDEDKNDLSKQEVQSLLKKIFPNQKINNKILFDFLYSLQSNYRNTIDNISDGKIDWTSQGREGDCWLLAEVRALSQTEWGADAIKNSILNDSINRVYKVKLKGVNFTCDINYGEIAKERKNKKRPSGDIDMLLLELATEKFFNQEVEAGRMKAKKKGVIHGGPLMGESTMQYLITGKKGHSFYIQSKKQSNEEIEKASQMIKENDEAREYYTKYKDNISNLYNKDDKVKFMQKLAQKVKTCSITCSFRDTKEWDNKNNYKKSDKKNNFNHQENHAYTVENIIIDANGNITDILLINPWQPNNVIHKSLNEFLDQALEICVTNEQDDYNDIKELCEPCWINI